MTDIDRRESILAAAWECFAGLGYKAATIDAIARTAAMGKGTFYNYFATKEEVLFALVEKAGDAMGRSADDFIGTASGDAPSLVQSYLSAIIAYRDDYRLYRNLVFEAKATGSPTVAEALSRLDRRFESELARMLRSFSERGLIAERDYDTVALILIESYSALIAWRDAEGRPLSEERIKKAMSDMLCRGLLGA